MYRVGKKNKLRVTKITELDRPVEYCNFIPNYDPDIINQSSVNNMNSVGIEDADEAMLFISHNKSVIQFHELLINSMIFMGEKFDIDIVK